MSPRLSLARYAFALASLLPTGGVTQAQASGVSPVPPEGSMFIQLFIGKGFDDSSYALNTSDGIIRTMLLGGDGRWRYGENTFYVRIFSGDFVDGAGARLGLHARMYFEWTSRLSLLALGARDTRDKRALRDVFLAMQLNRGGTGFRANLVGAGVKLAWPGSLVTRTTVYYRDAPGEDPGIKVRTSWGMPFTLARLPLVLEGSEDLVTGTVTGLDRNGQPALLLDLGRMRGGAPGVLTAGVEWFHHETRGTRLSAPQATVRFAF